MIDRVTKLFSRSGFTYLLEWQVAFGTGLNIEVEFIWAKEKAIEMFM